MRGKKNRVDICGICNSKINTRYFDCGCIKTDPIPPPDTRIIVTKQNGKVYRGITNENSTMMITGDVPPEATSFGYVCVRWGVVKWELWKPEKPTTGGEV